MNSKTLNKPPVTKIRNTYAKRVRAGTLKPLPAHFKPAISSQIHIEEDAREILQSRRKLKRLLRETRMEGEQEVYIRVEKQTSPEDAYLLKARREWLPELRSEPAYEDCVAALRDSYVWLLRRRIASLEADSDGVVEAIQKKAQAGDIRAMRLFIKYLALKPKLEEARSSKNTGNHFTVEELDALRKDIETAKEKLEIQLHA